MASSAGSGTGFIQTAAGALTLRDEAFHSLREDPRPFVRGLVFILIVGVIIALASVVGTVLTAWTSPNMDSLFEAIKEGVKAMPWRQQIPAHALEEADESMDLVFDMVQNIVGFFSPNIPMALVGLILQPLGMVFGWLVFGVLAFLFAKLFGGNGTLSQTYGATSLAAAPYLLGVVHVFPYVEAAGLGVWALICAYLGVKHAHQITPGRAFWATLLPMVVMFVVAVAVGLGLGAVIAISQFGMGGAG